MRSTTWARWATCALAISTCVPAAFADKSKKSLASCTSFEQEDAGEDQVQFTVHNTCSIPIDCAISWRVVCAPDSRKRRATHPGAARLALPEMGAQSAKASAGVCGDDAWTIDSIQWSCEPNKD